MRYKGQSSVKINGRSSSKLAVHLGITSGKNQIGS